MLSRTGLLAAIAALSISAAGEAAPLLIESTFDTTLEGWSTTDSGSFQHVASGGNPDGFLRLDNCECTIASIVAPAAFLGDLSVFAGGTFSFDGNLLGNGGSFFDGPNSIPAGPFLDYGIITFSGPSVTAQVDLLPNGATAPLRAWQTYSLTLTAANLGLSNVDFTTLLENVTSLTITIEGLWGAEVQGIDNVRLTARTTAPEPATLVLLAVGATMSVMRASRQRVGSRRLTRG